MTSQRLWNPCRFRSRKENRTGGGDSARFFLVRATSPTGGEHGAKRRAQSRHRRQARLGIPGILRILFFSTVCVSAKCCEILKAHGCVVCWLAGHIAQSRYCEQGGRTRPTERMASSVPCAFEFSGALCSLATKCSQSIKSIKSILSILPPLTVCALRHVLWWYIFLKNSFFFENSLDFFVYYSILKR